MMSPRKALWLAILRISSECANRIMNVLHLPYNIASQITVTVRALRAIGVPARGLANTGVVTSNAIIEPLALGARSLPQRIAQRLRRAMFIAQAIRWADVVHWHYDQGLRFGLDLRLAQRWGKRRIVEFWGSDIRIPEVEARDNPYYARIMADYEYKDSESYSGSRRRQRRFAQQGFAALTPCPSLVPHLFPDLFAQIYHTRQRVDLADYQPRYPNPDVTRPRVMHSPTAPKFKGTWAVEAAITQLVDTYAFEYQRVQNMPHHQAKQMMQQCDFFVDQLIGGSHGLAALEAMAYGKPVICYIKPSMVAQYPPDLPIVSATIDNLPEVLAQLLEDGALRHELGRRGRAYVEKYHDAHMLARELVTIYQQLRP